MGYNFRGRGTGTTAASPKYGNTPASCATIVVPSSLTLPIVAVRIPGYAMAFVGYGANKSNYAYITDAPAGTAFEYFIFDRAATSSSGKNYGLQIWHETSGELVFDSNIPPMRVLGLLSYARSGPAHLSGSGAGTRSGTWSGRKLALAQGGFSGHSIPGERIVYGPGGQIIRDLSLIHI